MKDLKKFTVFFEQINRTHFEVMAVNDEDAEKIAIELYDKNHETPTSSVQKGW